MKREYKKVCGTCHQEKPSDHFYRDRGSRDGLARRCRICVMTSNYKLAPGEYEKAFAEQKGKCAICGDPDDLLARLEVDHDHRTHKMRGLLCHRCNTMLGHARDRIDVLTMAISYLQK